MQPIFPMCVVAVACAFLVTQSLPALAQPEMKGKEVKGFVYPEFGQDGALKWRLKGNARFETEQQAHLSDVQGEAFEDGKRQLLFLTPFCYFDREKKLATTEREVEVLGNNFTITGQGFVWDGEAGRIMMRRNVRVVVKNARGYLASPAKQGAAEPAVNRNEP